MSDTVTLANGDKRIYLYAADASPFTLPADFSSTNTIECIGGGGKGTTGTGGAGGGAFAGIAGFSGAPGSNQAFSVGAAGASSTTDGGPSWFGSTSTVYAPGGQSELNGGLGGQVGSCIGTTKFSGGSKNATSGVGASGGAACFGGIGGNAPRNNGGSGGAGGGGGGSGNGGDGQNWDATHGAGGGGRSGIPGGLYGAGGDGGAPGLIVITYTPTAGGTPTPPPSRRAPRTFRFL